jgi:hypothetical protein
MARIVVPEILGPDGKPARRGGKTFNEILTETHKAHPDWSNAAVRWQAEKMYDRLPFLQEAIEAGLHTDVGRELRQRWEANLGVEAELKDSMEKPMRAFITALLALEPGERGYVLDFLKKKITETYE